MQVDSNYGNASLFKTPVANVPGTMWSIIINKQEDDLLLKRNG